jgi:hypothetical protein
LVLELGVVGFQLRMMLRADVVGYDGLLVGVMRWLYSGSNRSVLLEV